MMATSCFVIPQTTKPDPVFLLNILVKMKILYTSILLVMLISGSADACANHLFPGMRHPVFFLKSFSGSRNAPVYPSVFALKNWGLDEEWYWYLDDSMQEIVLIQKKIDVDHSNANELKYSEVEYRSSASSILGNGLKKYWEAVIKKTRYPDDIIEYRRFAHDAPVYVFSCYYIFGEISPNADRDMKICLVADMVRLYVISETNEERKNLLSNIMKEMEER